MERENKGFPKVAVDYAGRKIRFEEPPESFISTLPSNTEILFALGLGSKVKVVSIYCDYPPEIEEAGMAWKDLDPEKIGEMVPDLILAGSGQELWADVAGVVPGVSYFILAAQTFDEVVESIILVGDITDREEKASVIAAEMMGKKEKVSERSSQILPDEKPDVLVLAFPEELLAAGKGTLADELLGIAGGSNAAVAGEGYYALDKEELLNLDPEIIIFITPWKKLFTGEDWHHDLQAFENDRVYQMDGALLTRPGPRLAEGLEEVFELLHGKQ